MKISIIGLGWFGSSLAKSLESSHEILGTTRDSCKAAKFTQRNIRAQVLEMISSPSAELMNSDVIVLNIPPFKDQLSWFRSWKWQKSTHIIFISSTSVYGDESQDCDEADLPVPTTENGHILLEEEEWIKSFPKYTIIRFGGLIGEERHPGKHLSGRKNLSGGNSPVNLIHLEDAIHFTKLVISERLIGETFNLVSPEHPSRREYYTSFCSQHNLPLPEFEDSQGRGKIISQKKVSKIYQHRISLKNS